MTVMNITVAPSSTAYSLEIFCFPLWNEKYCVKFKVVKVYHARLLIKLHFRNLRKLTKDVRVFLQFVIFYKIGRNLTNLQLWLWWKSLMLEFLLFPRALFWPFSFPVTFYRPFKHLQEVLAYLVNGTLPNLN